MVTIKPENVQLKLSDKFFFDTNIWLLLFGTIADYQKPDQKSYSTFFQKLIQRNIPIFITSGVVSEFANVILRNEFRRWEFTSGVVGANYKKDFVGTKGYNDAVDEVKLLLEKIFEIPVLLKVSDSFNRVILEKVNDNFGKIDFNDAYFAEIARLDDYKLVTNDSDFKNLNMNITVITTK